MWLLLLLLLLIVVCLAFCGQRLAFIGGRDNIKDLAKHPRTKSEARAIAELERLTGKKFPTVRPDFLKYRGKRLELDGYNRELGVAVEFSGPLHTKWYPNKESYEKYEERLAVDDAKRELCKKHGILLIVIDMRLPVWQYRDYFASRLFDAKKINEPPFKYIPQHVVEPFRRGIN